MRLAYLFDRPLPAVETDSEQAIQTIAALARRGHEVGLVLPSVGGEGPPSAELLDYYQTTGEFELEYVPNPWLRRPKLRKWFHARAALESRTVQAAQVIYTRNFPTLFRLPASQRPFVYETYRPWMDQFPPLRSPFRKALSAPHALGAILHSRYAAARYEALGIGAERVAVVHNGYDPSRFEPRMSAREARERLDLPLGRPLIVYTGHVNLTKGLDSVLRLADHCPEALFLLVGSAGYGPVEWLGRNRSNVRFIPWQSFTGTVPYLLAADILLQPPSLLPLTVVGNTVLPMKLFLYLAARRAILAPRAPDTAELLRHEDNALLVSPGDVQGASQAVHRLVRDAALRERLAANALASAKALTWDARAAKIEDFIACRSAGFGFGTESPARR